MEIVVSNLKADAPIFIQVRVVSIIFSLSLLIPLVHNDERSVKRGNSNSLCTILLTFL